jgi:ABC-type sugar transport system ATPase subunit
MSSVRLHNLIKRFGQHTVLKGISLDVPDGSFMVMVGPSGCGKSTALRSIAGLEEVSEGDIFIGDENVTHREPKDRNIAMVFQNYALYPHMNVFDNITYGLKVRGLPKAERASRAQTAAKLLGLDGLLDRMPKQLSGGQRQRVAMGRAIVREPSVFLFDEPLSNLDANLRNQMRIELRRLHQRLATTSIYVTHDQVEAMTLAEKILVLRGGSVEQYGTPDEIYYRPASVFVAQFMGSPAMNILPVSNTAEGLALKNVLLPAVQAADICLNKGGGELLLGVRSEDVLLQPDSAAPAIEAVVDITEALGSDTLAHCHLAGQESPLIVRLAGALRPVAGDRLRLTVRPGHGHVFHPETEQRCC